MHQFAIPKRAERPLTIWLSVVLVLLIAMILLGGITRLTDSGLSITEWKPVTGAIPPLSVEDWQSEFAKYQQIPEFKLQNSDMNLSEFKAIYWWEWAHRFLGRLIGVVVAVPLLTFWFMGYLSSALKLRLSMLFVLGAVQGFLGWWMVYSGLGSQGDTLDVSPYRLVIHLGMALAIFALTFWTLLDVGQASSRRTWRVKTGVSGLTWAVSIMVFIQILLGGFVAATDGGKIANTWPLFQSGIFPNQFGELIPTWRNFFESPHLTQFNHRMGAYLLLGLTLVTFVKANQEKVFQVRQFARILLLAIALQTAFGVWTLLAVAPVSLAIFHQVIALLVFLTAINLTHATSRFYLSS